MNREPNTLAALCVGVTLGLVIMQAVGLINAPWWVIMIPVLWPLALIAGIVIVVPIAIIVAVGVIGFFAWLEDRRANR